MLTRTHRQNLALHRVGRDQNLPPCPAKTGKNICVKLLTVFKIYDVESGVVNHFLRSSAKKNNSKTLNHRVRLDLV